MKTGLNSKTLREGVKGMRGNPLGGSAASKAKPKKGQLVRSYHRVFIDNGEVRHFVLFRGVRFLRNKHLRKSLVSKKMLDNNR